MTLTADDCRRNARNLRYWATAKHAAQPLLNDLNEAAEFLEAIANQGGLLSRSEEISHSPESEGPSASRDF